MGRASACAAIAVALLASSSSARADGETYEPSRFRVEVGPILWVPFETNDFDVYAIGATAAFQYFFDRNRVFFVGGRLAFLGDPGGLGAGYVGGFADAEVGARPRLIARGKNAFELVLGVGAGAGFIDNPSVSPPPSGFAHLSFRAGLGFDVGAFTMDVLGGLAMFGSSDGADGAVEALVEGGVRF